MSVAVAPRTAPAPVVALRASTGRRGVPATVTLRRTALADLQDELTAVNCEGLAFATLAIGIAAALYGASKVGNWFTVQENAGRLDAAARRYVRQREGER